MKKIFIILLVLISYYSVYWIGIQHGIEYSLKASGNW